MTNKKFICLCVFVVLFFTLSHAFGNGFVVINVSKNDSLVNICKTFLEEPRKWPEIAKINRIKNPDLIFPGQNIIVPVSMLKGVPIEGLVTFIKGDVQVQPEEGGTWHKLHLNDSVRLGSGIITGDESSVEISFEDGASFFLVSNTVLELQNARKKAGLHIVRELFLKVGRSITRLKKAMGKDSRFEIKTPSAVAAARGTEFRVSVDIHETTRTEVLKGIIGVDAMKRKVEIMAGEGTIVKKNGTPAKPRKLLPPPTPVGLKELYRTMPMEFHFIPVQGAVRYRGMLARDEHFKDIVKEKIIAPGHSLEIVGVDDGDYYLQSRSIDNEGLEGIPSNAIPIHVRVNPLPPFIQAPVQNAELRERSVSFNWLNVQDADGYHIQISEDYEFKKIVHDNDATGKTSYRLNELDFRTYYFRVRSVAADGYNGIWSDVQSFSIIPPPPAPPVEPPEMGEEGIHMRWRNLGEGVSYRFQMARDKEFEEILVEKKLESPEIMLPKPVESGMYYVRTSGIDSEGYEGDFSLPQSFEIKQRFPYEIAGIVGGVVLIFLLVP